MTDPICKHTSIILRRILNFLLLEMNLRTYPGLELTDTIKFQ